VAAEFSHTILHRQNIYDAVKKAAPVAKNNQADNKSNTPAP